VPTAQARLCYTANAFKQDIDRQALVFEGKIRADRARLVSIGSCPGFRDPGINLVQRESTAWQEWPALIGRLSVALLTK